MEYDDDDGGIALMVGSTVTACIWIALYIFFLVLRSTLRSGFLFIRPCSAAACVPAFRHRGTNTYAHKSYHTSLPFLYIIYVVCGGRHADDQVQNLKDRPEQTCGCGKNACHLHWFLGNIAFWSLLGGFFLTEQM